MKKNNTFKKWIALFLSVAMVAVSGITTNTSMRAADDTVVQESNTTDGANATTTEEGAVAENDSGATEVPPASGETPNTTQEITLNNDEATDPQASDATTTDADGEKKEDAKDDGTDSTEMDSKSDDSDKNSESVSSSSSSSSSSSEEAADEVLQEKEQIQKALEDATESTYTYDDNNISVTAWAPGSTTITHQVSDTARTYQIRYKKLTADSSESYNWYILFYSSETNRCIGSDVVEVKPGAQAVYKVQKTMEVNGTNYTVNKLFDQDTLSHEYADTNHTTYIYYDPEGYNNSSEVKTKDINIQYVDIANGNVIQSLTQQVSSDADTKLSFPDSIDANGIHYLRVAGQVASVDYNYYSPKEIYTVYYYDENNTEFQTSVITTEEVQEVIIPGPTTYRVLPGITRTIVTNTDNGVSTVVSTNDATGAEIIPTPADNIQLSNGTSGSDENGDSSDESSTAESSDDTGSKDSQDVTVDGVHADDLQTPESNIWLDSTAEDSSSAKTVVLVIIGLAALAACVIATILLVRRARSNRKH